jgi:hypothetical protein
LTIVASGTPIWSRDIFCHSERQKWSGVPGLPPTVGKRENLSQKNKNKHVGSLMRKPETWGITSDQVTA